MRFPQSVIYLTVCQSELELNLVPFLNPTNAIVPNLIVLFLTKRVQKYQGNKADNELTVPKAMATSNFDMASCSSAQTP